MGRERAFLIAGPTASGKSELALRLAERHRGTVINADSMAVYSDLTILTGRPASADLTRAPHRLYGHVDAGTAYSVARWLNAAAQAIEAAWQEGRVPILVGGTGLYMKALTQGLSDIPVVPEALRERLRAASQGRPPRELHARLAMVDPVTAARLRPTDPQRILRAIEVYEATGQPLSSYQGRRRPPPLPRGRYAGVVIDPGRERLRDAIDQRFDAMMKAGALEEARTLARRELDPQLPAMRALGVRPLLDHLAGSLSIEDAIGRAKAQTRAYAKRQVTFARHQLRDFVWSEPAGAERILIGD